MGNICGVCLKYSTAQFVTINWKYASFAHFFVCFTFFYLVLKTILGRNQGFYILNLAHLFLTFFYHYIFPFGLSHPHLSFTPASIFLQALLPLKHPSTELLQPFQVKKGSFNSGWCSWKLQLRPWTPCLTPLNIHQMTKFLFFLITDECLNQKVAAL